MSEALIFASTNPQHDDRSFIELQVQYMKIPSSNLGRTCCVQKLFVTFGTIFVHNMFSPCSAKRRATDKDLLVPALKTFDSFNKSHTLLLDGSYEIRYISSKVTVPSIFDTFLVTSNMHSWSFWSFFLLAWPSYRLFFLRSIAQFLTQIYMNCFVSS